MCLNLTLVQESLSPFNLLRLQIFVLFSPSTCTFFIRVINNIPQALRLQFRITSGVFSKFRGWGTPFWVVIRWGRNLGGGRAEPGAENTLVIRPDDRREESAAGSSTADPKGRGAEKFFVSENHPAAEVFS